MEKQVHFGYSHQQATLHAGVAHTKTGVISFCSISSSMRHDPSAIWANLNTVLHYLKALNPAVTTLHVIIDGPTTQYRSKKNFFFLSKIPFPMGFKRDHVELMEADGIGAAVKRQADSLVPNGLDCPNGRVLY